MTDINNSLHPSKPTYDGPQNDAGRTVLVGVLGGIIFRCRISGVSAASRRAARPSASPSARLARIAAQRDPPKLQHLAGRSAAAVRPQPNAEGSTDANARRTIEDTGRRVSMQPRLERDSANHDMGTEQRMRRSPCLFLCLVMLLEIAMPAVARADALAIVRSYAATLERFDTRLDDAQALHLALRTVGQASAYGLDARLSCRPRRR